MAAAVSDEAWLAALLQVEAALAEAEAEAGVIPGHAAAAIRAACDPARFDLVELGREAAAAGTPVVPLVKALTGLAGEAAGYVHWGTTSQDVLDTAMMLIARRALDLLIEELDGLTDICAALAERHRDTLMAGRTLLQQALPITFGLKAAGWLVALEEARDVLAMLRDRRLAVQLGGAAGTLAALGERGLEVAHALASRLALAEPVLPWHSARGRVAELGSGLALAAGAAAKVSLDVVLLSQTEIGEAAEGAPGVSSAMPQKRNPVAAVEARACFYGVQAQASVLLAALPGEHERSAGAWQAEWPALSEAFRLAAGAVARTRQAVDGLQVDAVRMRANLDLTGGLVLAEAVVMALAPRLGRRRAEELVRKAVDRAVEGARAAGRPGGGEASFGDQVRDDPEIGAHLTPRELESCLDPGRYLGATQTLVERALAAHRARRASA